MHIAYLSSALSVHDERFLSKLVERGHRTTLITYYPGALPPRIAAIRGLAVIHQRPGLLARYDSGLFAFKAPGLRRLLSALRPDVLHSGYVWKDGFAGALAGFHPHLVMPWGSDILIEPDQASLLREATQPDVVLAVLAPALQEAPPESKETSHPDSTPTRAG